MLYIYIYFKKIKIHFKMIGEINLFYIFITVHLNKHIYFFYIYFFLLKH
jgi:hypothetical protein